MPNESPPPRPRGRTRIALEAAALVGLLAWASRDPLRSMVERWSGDARYSHGFLVVPFALYLMWTRRGMLAGGDVRGSWWGLAGLAAAAALRWAGDRYFLGWLSGASLLAGLAGAALLLGGWRGLRWAGPSIAFLLFMIPLPYQAEAALGGPTQAVAARASTYVLQALGRPAYAEGYVIRVGEARIGVVEACNGLGMLWTFLAVAVAVALLVRRPPLDLALLILSAPPIAVAANVGRIALTGLLHEWAGGEVADTLYHDLAGWIMMPAALAVLAAELAILDRLLVPAEAGDPVGGYLAAGGLPRAVVRPTTEADAARRAGATGPGRRI